ncbi:otogelin-like [Ciona intestinalis]
MEECISDVQCNVALNCPGNQQYSTCHGCTVPCSDRDSPEPCPRICQIGCYCPPGTYLLGEQCVSRQQCETAQTGCPGNQIRVQCGSGCPLPTCEIPNPPSTVCPTVCRTCVCPTNTVLNGDHCIPYNQCPSTATNPPTGKICPGNQIRVQCGSGCPLPTCEIPNPPSTVCPTVCRTCVCPTNTVLNGDQCIPYNQCPSTVTNPPTGN